MSLISYENLPSFMKNKKVKKYYDILKKKKLYLSLKRIFDFYAGTALVVVFALPMGVIAYKIKKSSPPAGSTSPSASPPSAFHPYRTKGIRSTRQS